MQPALSLLTFVKKYWLVITLICVGVIGSAVATVAYVGYVKTMVKTPESEVVAVSPTPSPPPDPLRPYSVLLLGYGGPGHSGGSLTDTMLLAYIEPRKQHATLFSIPRDLWVELPLSVEKTQWSKINAAFAIGNDDKKYVGKAPEFTGSGGGGRLAKSVVGSIFGFPVDFFVAVDFTGFERVYDALSPLEINVPVTFDDQFYPIAGKENETCEKTEEEIAALTATMSGYLLEQAFPCRYEQLHFDAGLQSMDAQTALKFVRSRHSEQHGGDFGRSQRQQALLTAIEKKLTTPLGFAKLLPTALSLTKYVQTDITPAKITEVITTHEGLTDYTLETVVISEKNVLTHGYSADKQYILMPKSGQGEWTSIQEFFKQQVSTDSAKVQ